MIDAKRLAEMMQPENLREQARVFEHLGSKPSGLRGRYADVAAVLREVAEVCPASEAACDSCANGPECTRKPQTEADARRMAEEKRKG